MKYAYLTGIFSATRLRSLFSTPRVQQWLLPVCIGLVYFLLQLTQISQYGVSWDEPLHRNWGKLFLHFWNTGDRLALELMPGHGIEYGPIFYVVNYLFSEWAYNAGFLTFVEANHILTLFTASVVVALTYVLGRMMGGWKIGLGSVLFLVLFPQFLAHSHYNPKDIPLMAAVLCTCIFFLAALRKASIASFVLAGFSMGVAIALKISALIMAPVFLLVYLLWLSTDVRSVSLRSFQRQALLVSLTVVTVLVATYVFWPSAWGDIGIIVHSVQFFLSSNFWPGQVLYFGTQYGGADLPWHYIPFSFFGATPFLTLLAFCTGLFVLMCSMFKNKERTEYAFLLLWIALPLTITLIPKIVRYDGIRQFFFVVPPMCIIAALGLRQLVRWLRGKKEKKGAVFVFLFFVLLSLGGEVILLHPYEGSYRNEIVRALYPQDMDRTFQIEYWGATYLQGMNWLMEHAEPDPVICVPTAGILVTWYPWRPDFTFACDEDTNYVMFFTRYAEAKAYEDLKDPVFSIKRMNADLMNIYKI